MKKFSILFLTVVVSLFTVCRLAPADVAPSTDSLDFGDVGVGKTVSKTLVITNNENEVVNVTLSGLEGTDFTLNKSTLSINPHKTGKLTIKFKAKGAGTADEADTSDTLSEQDSEKLASLEEETNEVPDILDQQSVTLNGSWKGKKTGNTGDFQVSLKANVKLKAVSYLVQPYIDVTWSPPELGGQIKIAYQEWTDNEHKGIMIQITNNAIYCGTTGSELNPCFDYVNWKTKGHIISLDADCQETCDYEGSGTVLYGVYGSVDAQNEIMTIHFHSIYKNGGGIAKCPPPCNTNPIPVTPPDDPGNYIWPQGSEYSYQMPFSYNKNQNRWELSASNYMILLQGKYGVLITKQK